ncbi:MAG: type II toxin-antitoxin system mRNA interferase toxin, RelE/StbE family [Nanoarchaeota archaeon]|nr:type II toxin-antitoxin system mRNA interferase toxin, RelE/StbE family [Nanoarchaeota archaeon]
MNLKYTSRAKSRIKKACAKNREIDKALSRKIAFILTNPGQFKPLKYSHKGERRVHILKSFVLTYEIKGDIVYIIDFGHHDRAYR